MCMWYTDPIWIISTSPPFSYFISGAFKLLFLFLKKSIAGYSKIARIKLEQQNLSPLIVFWYLLSIIFLPLHSAPLFLSSRNHCSIQVALKRLDMEERMCNIPFPCNWSLVPTETAFFAFPQWEKRKTFSPAWISFMLIKSVLGFQGPVPWNAMYLLLIL